MPLGSSFSDMKATATVKVAPCSACAGPKTSPLNEWAIMMWSDTSTAYTDTPLITDKLAENAARGIEDVGQLLRQVGKCDRRAEQRVECGIVKQPQCFFQPAPVRPGCAMRRRDVPDLARHELQPLRVKCTAERHLYLPGAIPGEFQHRRLEGGKAERSRKPRLRRTRVKDEVALFGGLIGRRKRRAKLLRHLGARRLDVDQRHGRSRAFDAQPRH